MEHHEEVKHPTGDFNLRQFKSSADQKMRRNNPFYTDMPKQRRSQTNLKANHPN